MKLRNFLSLAALSLPLLVSARPAAPGLRTLINADGTTVQGYVYGDESFSWAVSADGKSLLEYTGGRWATAVRNGLALTADVAGIERLRADRPAYVIEESPVNGNKMRMAALENGRTKFPTIGDNIHSMVVLIEYADTKFTVPDPVNLFNEMLNQEGFSKYNAKGSVRDYYQACSNGLFNPTFDIYGPVTVSHNSEYYVGKDSGIAGAGANAYFGYAIKEALEQLDEQGVDFTKYDYDNDGAIDNIFFFYAGHGQADSGDPTTVWPHQSEWRRYTSDQTLKLPEIVFERGDKKVAFKTYACSNELQGSTLPEGASQPYLDGIGAFAHEFAHVLGLPDTYDVEPQPGKPTATPHYWDVMAQGTYNDSSTRPPLFNAYEQWVCHWLEYEDLTNADQIEGVEVPSLSTAYLKGEKPVCKRLRISRPGMATFYPEYYVVETRTRDGWDSALPGEGMLIWHVDYKALDWAQNLVNTNGVSKFTIVPSSSSSDVFPGKGDKAVTAIYPDGKVSLKPSTRGADFAPFITSIAFDADNKVSTFNYNTCVPIEDVTVMHKVEIVDELQRSFKLSWDKVDGASDYFLTVRRKQGASYYIVDGYDDTSVGDVTEVVIPTVSPAAWTQSIEAFVRCGNEVPGVNVSNTITFVPAQIAAAVSEIVLDGTVKGGYGCVEAPEGARVFNISGVETGKDNLPAGMYIVTLGGESVKVVVK